MNPKGAKAARARSLGDIAARLQIASVDAVLAAYQERNIAANRVLAMALATLWALLWYFLGPGEPRTPTGWNYPQSLDVLPYAIPMLVASIVWWQMLARGWVRQNGLADAMGAVANLLGTAVLLSRAWDLMIAFIVLLPMICVSIGARYSRNVFYMSIIASVIIVQVAAPHNYWPMRPHFLFFAVTLVVILPMSELRLLKTLRMVSDEALRSRDAQSRFIATMSHELRTPLNSVVNNTDLINTDAMPDGQRRIVESLAASAIALRNRVNDVLDVRAIDAGKLAFIDEPFTFDGIWRVVQGIVGPLAVAKNVELAFKRDEAASWILRSDPGRIEQILTNLCMNAAKFTPEGGRVTVSVESDGVRSDGRCAVRCTVTDTGIGVPADQKERIFEPFYQISSGTRRTHEGSGLGLHIVASVTRLLGGSVTVADNPGGGSIFTWRAAFERAAPGEQPADTFNMKQAVAEHRRRVRPLNCLVIDDKESNRELAGRLLNLVGHTMVAASGGREGLDAVCTGHFDIILLDLHMPESSGFDVLKELKVLFVETGHRIPVVMVSADADPAAVQRAKDLGAIGYFVKPIALGKLLSILEQIAGIDRPVEDTDKIVVVSSRDKAGSVSGLEAMRASGDAEATLAFVDACISGLDASLEQMYVAVQRNDRTAARAAAHAVKNEFINLGSLDGARLCEQFRSTHEDGTADILLNSLVSLSEVVKRQVRGEFIEPAVTQLRRTG